jgi:hypothetical protein
MNEESADCEETGCCEGDEIGRCFVGCRLW